MTGSLNPKAFTGAAASAKETLRKTDGSLEGSAAQEQRPRPRARQKPQGQPPRAADNLR